MAKSRFYQDSGFIARKSDGEIIGSWWRANNRFFFKTESNGLQQIVNRLRREGLEPYMRKQRSRIPFGSITRSELRIALGAAGFTMQDQDPQEKLQLTAEALPVDLKKKRNRLLASRDRKFYLIRNKDLRTVGLISWFLPGKGPVVELIQDKTAEKLLLSWKKAGVSTVRRPAYITVITKNRKDPTTAALQRITVEWKNVSSHELELALRRHGYTLVPASIVESDKNWAEP